MSNCEKKLDALIDALGFDVEGDLDRESYNRQVMIQQQCGSNVQVDMSDHFQYKLTKRNQDNESLLIEKLKVVEAQLPILIKAVYEDGFRDARKEDYSGCDAFAMWESSESKKELER